MIKVSNDMYCTPKKLTWVLLAMIILLPAYFWWFHSCTKLQFTVPYRQEHYSVWPEFSVETDFTQGFFLENCVGSMQDMSIGKLHSLVEEWSTATHPKCRELYSKFTAIYSISKRTTPLLLPDQFKEKVKTWLGNNDQLFQQIYKQEVTHIYNMFTHEYTIFNPLRDKRPLKKPDEPERYYVERLAETSRKGCDFCNFKNYTAEHMTHRLETQLSFTASNTFKLEKWHALFLMKAHHPLNWTQPQLMDVMQISLDWFKMAHNNDPLAQYPAVVWDMFPHAGASQIHPHLHGLLSPGFYHGNVELWRRAGEDYYQQMSANYFSDLISIYSTLGLAVRYGDAIAFPNIVPKKDHEVVIMSRHPGESFFKLIYFTIRAFIDDIEKLSFSMGMGYPPLATSKGKIPAFARIVTRGAVAEVRTDMSSLELFAATNVNIDPYNVIQMVRNSISKRHKS